jgi:hypothetical protein
MLGTCGRNSAGRILQNANPPALNVSARGTRCPSLAPIKAARVRVRCGRRGFCRAKRRAYLSRNAAIPAAVPALTSITPTVAGKRDAGRNSQGYREVFKAPTIDASSQADGIPTRLHTRFLPRDWCLAKQKFFLLLSCLAGCCVLTDAETRKR